MNGETEMLTFIAAYYEDGDPVVSRWGAVFDQEMAEDISSTLEDAPYWVRKRVALINLSCETDYEDCELGGWSRDRKAYWIVVTKKTALTWGKGWRKRD